MEEIWKPVLGYEGLYEVSSFGRVRTTPKIRKLAVDEDGYIRVALSSRSRGKKLVGVHTLVLEAFKGPRPHGNVGRHLDGSKDNNIPDNLEWGTAFENWEDCRKHGTDRLGGANGNTKLTDEKVVEIRDLVKRSVPKRKIARMFGISDSNVRCIARCVTWKHL